MLNKIIIYTDGSCIPNPGAGGWAAVINRNKDIEIISGAVTYSTNNRMEIQAIIEVISHLYQESKELVIHTDSGYVVNTLERKWIENWEKNGWKTAKGDNVKNKDLWIKIKNEMMMTQCKISFVKVKGHSGNKFNELVHEEALAQANKMNDKIEARSLGSQ